MATQQGTVSIELALQGLAVVERGLDNIKKSFGALGQNVKNLQKDFDSVGKGLNTVIKDLKRAFTEGGLNKLKDQFKESVSTLKTALPMMLRGSLLGFASTVTSSIAGIVKKAFTALPKQIISQLTGLYNTVKSITGFDQFFNAGSVLQGSIALANYTKTLKAQSDQTAIDIQQTLNLRTAMELVGVESDNLGKRISYMGKQLTKAFGGSAPDTLKVLKELGITESMITKMDTAQRFTEIANSINKLSDPAKQARAAIMLFDRAGNELLPFFRNFNKSTEDAKKILGDLPSILNKNQQSFVKFSNAISNLQIKRQQFFAGFLDVAQVPFNALLDKVLSINFTSFGQKVADNFKQTLNSIQQGDFKGFIENFSLEFSDAFLKGFNLFIAKIPTLDFTPLIDKFVEVGLKISWTVLKKTFEVSQDLLAGWFTSSARKNLNKFLGGLSPASKIIDLYIGTPTEAPTQEQVRKVEEYIKRIQTANEEAEKKQKELDKARQERLNVIIDLLDKVKQKARDDINDSKLALMSANLKYNEIQSNPFLSATEKRSAQVENLQKQYDELQAQLVNTLKLNDSFSKAIDERMAPYIDRFAFSLEYLKEVSEGVEKELTDKLNRAITNFAKTKNPADFNFIKNLIPEEQIDTIASKFDAIAKIKIQKDSLLDSAVYEELDESLKNVNYWLSHYQNVQEFIKNSHYTNEIERANDLYYTQQEQIRLLNKELTLLTDKKNLAFEKADKDRVDEIAKAIENVNLQIAKLNAQPDPRFFANLKSTIYDLEIVNETIEKAIARTNTDWTKSQNEKWKETKESYETLISYTKETIKALEEQAKHLQNRAELEATIEEIKRLNNELFNLEMNLQALGADPDDLVANMRASFTQLKDEFGTLSQNLADGFTNSVMSMRDSFSDFMYDVFRGAKSGKEALDEMWLSMGRTALRAITDTISNFIMQHTVMTALEYAFSATTIALNEATNSAIMAENSATAAAMAEMWKPSAIWASIASMGGAVAVGLAAMAGIMGIMGGFAEGGRVKGGKQISWLNEEGSEFVVSARSPRDNDKWLEAANRGVSLDDLAMANAAFIRQSESQQSNAQPQTVKQVTVRTAADIRREWKEGGLIEFVRNENLRRGWA
jgi:predicted nuclease with TOPRIM domain